MDFLRIPRHYLMPSNNAALPAAFLLLRFRVSLGSDHCSNVIIQTIPGVREREREKKKKE
eukprot:943558-Amorphochlora_amoeboformis.AAC.1